MQHRLTWKLAAGHKRFVAIALYALVAFSLAGAPACAVPTLDEVAADFGLSKDDVQRVRNGELVNTTTKETSERELAVVMVFLVDGAYVIADRDFYVSAGSKSGGSSRRPARASKASEAFCLWHKLPSDGNGGSLMRPPALNGVGDFGDRDDGGA